MADICKKRLTVPAKFVPYMEKHHLHELFHALSTELVMKQPDDHVLFIKQALLHLPKGTKRPKIVLIAPPHIGNKFEFQISYNDNRRYVQDYRYLHPHNNRKKTNHPQNPTILKLLDNDRIQTGIEVFDHLPDLINGFFENNSLQLSMTIASIVGVQCVTHIDILSTLPHVNNQEELSTDPEAFARRVRRFLRLEPCLSNGWILADFPVMRQDAYYLQKAGVLPTHTFQLIPSAIEDSEHLMDCKKKKSTSEDEIKEQLFTYRRNLLGLRDVYRSTLIEVEVRERTVEELGSDMAVLAKMMPHRGAPMLPRILIIGQRGSGRQTQAKLLCKRFSVVHVDFDMLMAKTRLEDGKLQDKVRLIESKHIEVYPEILLKIIETCILSSDCLKYGWVMTGYPRNVDEFKLLDSTDTPPNRVVFLNVPHNICVGRLKDRRYNMYTGSEHHLVTKPPQGKSKKQIKIHPMDHPVVLEVTLPLYENKVKEMSDYAGGTSTHVDGTLPVNTVFELVSAVVVRPAPACFPRGNMQTIDAAVQTSDSYIQVECKSLIVD